MPIYETSSAEQVAWILSDSGAVACFVETDAHAALIAGVRDRLRDCDHSGRSTPARSTSSSPSGAAVDPPRSSGAARPPSADDLATIIYTSGTTGRPKGCVLTHRNMYADIANAIPVCRTSSTRARRTLLFLPLAHAFARLIQIGVVQARATMGHTADVKNLVADLQAFQPTFVLSVPRVFEKVYNGARQKAHADGKGAHLRPGRAGRHRVQRGARHPGGPGLALGPARALRQAGLRASCAPRSAAGCRARSPAAPRSASGSATSSAASA